MLLVVFYIIYNGYIDLSAIGKSLSSIYAVYVILFLFLTYLFSGFRWLFLLKAQGVNVRLINILKLTLVGNFFNLLIPGGVSGDLVKSVMLFDSAEIKKVQAGLSVVMDRLIGLLSMCLMALLSVLFMKNSFKNNIMTEIFLILLTISICLISSFFLVRVPKFWVFIFSVCRYFKLPKLEKIFESVYQSFTLYTQKKDILLYGFLFSIAAQVFSVIAFAMVGFSLGYQIDLATYFLVVPCGLILTSFPVTPAGIGYGQAVYLFLFNNVLENSHQNTGPNIATGLQILSMFWVFVGFIIYIFETFNRKIK